VSAGASLGAMLVIIFGLTVSVGPFSAVPLASFAGAAVATAIVYWLATPYRKAMSTAVLLLAGVTMNAFFSALILFVQYLADFTQSFRTVRWLMGDLDVGSYGPLLAALPLLLLAFAAFAVLPRTLNLLTLGTDVAAARGVDVARAERVAFVSASLATGAAVSLAGPIGRNASSSRAIVKPCGSTPITVTGDSSSMIWRPMASDVPPISRCQNA